MAKGKSGQKFIGRNRPPRVQIEYEGVAGTPKKELPFILGVMADLSGNPEEPPPDVAERKFLEFNGGNIDDRLKAAKPRVAFMVDNTLTGQGQLPVSLTFESMDDFSPVAVARKVDSLNKILTARTQLKNLLAHMDGKADAVKWLEQLLQNPAQLQAVVSATAPKQVSDGQEAKTNG